MLISLALVSTVVAIDIFCFIYLRFCAFRDDPNFKLEKKVKTEPEMPDNTDTPDEGSQGEKKKKKNKDWVK